MDQLIDDITDRLLDRLPEGRPYYAVEELRGLDLPAFLTRRLLLQLRHNLMESLPEPRSEWADLQSPEAVRRWEDFLEGAVDSIRLPQGRARAVFRDAVEGCLELLVRPREVIPRLLFGSNRELDRTRLERRLEWVVVYPHFHSLLPRYMEKKDLETLDRERCASIIRNADRKICQRYDTDSWIELLEPLFELTGGEIPHGLLADFFREKELSGMADRLDERGGTLGRVELRRVLEGRGEREEEAPGDAREPRVADRVTREESGDSAQDNLNALFAQEQEAGEGQEPEGSARTPHDVKKGEYEVEEGEPAGMQEAAAQEDSDGDEEPTPMWMRYLDPVEAERLEREQQEEHLEQEWGEGEAELGEEEEPLFETGDENPGESAGSAQNRSDRAERLKRDLEDKRDYFVEQIFGGSKMAYDEALREIAERENWRSASRYIQQEIFKRNLVDMYSEPAVDFTDRLQSWFMNSSNNESK